jgi:hypothetical protein
MLRRETLNSELKHYLIICSKRTFFSYKQNAIKTERLRLPVNET